MSGEGVALILGAIGAFIGSVVLAIRGLSGDRFTHRVQEGASLLSGYTEMVASLRQEISDIRGDNEREISRLSEQHSKDMARASNHHRVELENTNYLHIQERDRWDVERRRMEERIEILEAQVTALLLHLKTPDQRDSRTSGVDPISP